MKYLLSPKNEDVLAALAWSRVLLAFDFDGTLAPIVEQRGASKMRARTAALFAELCQLYPCAVISGRELADVAARLRPAAAKYIVGNHGLEPGANLDEFESDMLAARAHFEQTIGDWPGVDLEDKRFSLALHYRRSRNKRLARAAIMQMIENLPVRVRVIPGKLVVNVVPEHAPHKGMALLELRAAESADTALYVGDDITDEDVFELDQPGRLLAVRVGASRSSAASYFIRDQRDIDRLLFKLVALRKGPRSHDGK